MIRQLFSLRSRSKTTTAYTEANCRNRKYKPFNRSIYCQGLRESCCIPLATAWSCLIKYCGQSKWSIEGFMAPPAIMDIGTVLFNSNT